MGPLNSHAITMPETEALPLPGFLYTCIYIEFVEKTPCRVKLMGRTVFLRYPNST